MRDGTKVTEKYAFSGPYRERQKPPAEFSPAETSTKSAGFWAFDVREVRCPKSGWRRERNRVRTFSTVTDSSLRLLRVHRRTSALPINNAADVRFAPQTV